MDRLMGPSGGTPVDSGAYTDLNRLSQLKVGKQRDSEGNIRKVAQEFESLFLNEMLKSMRSANEALGEGNFMNSETTKQYQDMYDQQLSVSLSKQAGGVGLADVLVRQLSPKHAAAKRDPFAQVGETQQATWPASGAAKRLPVPEEGRDDSAQLNRRRLALPGKLADRLLAGIVPSASDTFADVKNLAGTDWDAAQSYAAPQDKSLNVAGAEATVGRRIAQPPLAPAKSAFASAEDFVSTMLPLAESAAKRIGVDARYLVAQAALETGWGKSIIRQQDGTTSHNLFGIKAHGSWNGASARALTTEYTDGKAVKEAAEFRAYSSFEQSFQDYVSFLQGNARYQDALDVADKPERFVRELQNAGYATDPNYARKIGQIAKQMQTYQTVAAAGTVTRS